MQLKGPAIHPKPWQALGKKIGIASSHFQAWFELLDGNTFLSFYPPPLHVLLSPHFCSLLL